MKKKILSLVATLLLSCCFAIAQNGGIITIEDLSMEKGSELYIH